jgi:hypothetical protein
MEMRILSCILISIVASNFTYSDKPITSKSQDELILKIEMSLSAFGVESDDFPSIDAVIDFSNDSSHCAKWFYNPSNKDSVYYLSKQEIQSVLALLRISDLEKLKTEYHTKKPDQPSSKTVVYTTKRKFIINDYGLIGAYPLTELYEIVYK